MNYADARLYIMFNKKIGFKIGFSPSGDPKKRLSCITRRIVNYYHAYDEDFGPIILHKEYKIVRPRNCHCPKTTYPCSYKYSRTNRDTYLNSCAIEDLEMKILAQLREFYPSNELVDIIHKKTLKHSDYKKDKNMCSLGHTEWFSPLKMHEMQPFNLKYLHSELLTFVNRIEGFLAKEKYIFNGEEHFYEYKSIDHNGYLNNIKGLSDYEVLLSWGKHWKLYYYN